MKLSERMERLFSYAKSTWKDPPPCPFNRDFQYAAVNLFSDKEVWERAALSFAYALRRAPVIITDDDRIIGRAYQVRFAEPDCYDPELKDYSLQSPGFESGEAVYKGYTDLAELHLVTEPARGHITWDWTKILRLGTEGLKAQYENALRSAKDLEAEHFYRGVLIALEALEDWNDQHVAYLRKMGKQELADLCQHVPRHPARGFKEAIQSFFMQYLAVFYENPFGGNGPGQFDKYLWPYLKKDLENGSCTLEEAEELVEELFIRLDERVSANDLWNEMIITGGTHRDGSSAVSPLSKIMVDAIMKLNITHPTVYMRVPKDADEEYVKLCAKYLKYGNNRAQIYYDPNVIRALTETDGVRPEDATEYGVGGCLEIGIQGMNDDLLQCAWVNMPLMLELAITGGYSLSERKQVDSAGIPLPGLAQHNTFESFYKNYLDFTDRLVGISFSMIERQSIHDEKYRPAYLISSMIDDCLERGRHMHAGGARYHDYSMTPLGIPNVIDGLYAIRTAVFDQHICTAEELVSAMRADFKGYERLQRQLRAIPKYGQENDDADDFARTVVTDIAKMFVTRRNRFGGIFRPMVLTFIYAPLAAAQLGATADGNNMHTMVAQGLTPQSRSMSCGITAAMNSCTKMPFYYFSGGASTMWDLDPHWVSEKLIADLLMTFFHNGAQVFQGNTTDVKELIEAQKHPEDYEHLIVRVGGFSARFVGLTPGLQTDIINRRRHNR